MPQGKKQLNTSDLPGTLHNIHKVDFPRVQANHPGYPSRPKARKDAPGEEQRARRPLTWEIITMPSQRIRDLAGELNELISRITIRDDASGDPEVRPLVPTPEDWLETALETYNMRRMREKVFGSPQLFGEPTWDIMLDLFIGELRNTRMQTTSVCIGSQAPQTTALRWIALLEKEDLVHRYRDKTDSRRVYVQLTDRALKAMTRIFYERCFAMMERKRNASTAGVRSGPGTAGYDDVREAILDDAMAQIRIRRQDRI